MEVRRDGDRYRVTVDAHIEASPPQVLALIRDFDHLNRLHSSVVESETLSLEEHHAQVFVRMQGCILFFCRTVSQMLDFRSDPGGRYMVATMDPTQSDFKYGRMRWELQATARNTTRLRYQADMVPDFWVPPVIGPWVMKRRLRGVALEMTDALGRLPGEP